MPDPNHMTRGTNTFHYVVEIPEEKRHLVAGQATIWIGATSDIDPAQMPFTLSDGSKVYCRRATREEVKAL